LGKVIFSYGTVSESVVVYFPGMKKNEKLEGNIITPTTKAADHDLPISGAEVRDNIFKVFLCFMFSVHGELEWFSVLCNS
jgi:hypothetical protein